MTPYRITNMGPYLLFSGDGYYPLGGWRDFQGSFGSVQEAKDHVEAGTTHDWAQIVFLVGGGQMVAAAYRQNDRTWDWSPE